MSEPNLFSGVINSTGDIIKNLPEDVKNDLVRKPSQEIGEGLSNLIYVIFSPILKYRVKTEYSVKKLKVELENSISNIPDGKLIEPALNIVGPAIEGSKYHIEDDNIRALFVNLISSAANLEKRDRVHPSYVETIKQMSPNDAICLQFLINNLYSTACGVLRIYNEDGKGFQELKYFFPFPDLTIDNMNLYLASINNLIRLGLIECKDGIFPNESRYETFRSVVGKLAYEVEKKVREDRPKVNISIVEKAWVFTPLGDDFIKSCVLNE